MKSPEREAVDVIRYDCRGNSKDETSSIYRYSETPRLQRHDSLVFSITAEKCMSPYESDLLRESAHKTEGNSDKGEGRNLRDLDDGPNILFDCRQEIRTQRGPAGGYLSQLAAADQSQLTILQIDCELPNKSKHDGKENEVPNSLMKQTRNQSDPDKVGCFNKKNPVKRESRTNRASGPQAKQGFRSETQNARNHSFDSRDSSNYNNAVSKHRNTPASTGSKKETTYCSTPNDGDSWLQDLTARNKEVKKLRNELLRSKLHAEKSQRSRSLYIERFSSTKKSLGKFKKLAKDHEKMADRLARELKKGDNIRKKQKETIRKQKEEIRELRKLVAQLHKVQRN